MITIPVDAVEVTINDKTFDMTDTLIRNDIQNLLNEININDKDCNYVEVIKFIKKGIEHE